MIRVTAGGVMQAFGLSRISRVSSVGHFAAGPGGSMWTVGYGAGHAAVGLVQFTSAARRRSTRPRAASRRCAWQATARAG